MADAEKTEKLIRDCPDTNRAADGSAKSAAALARRFLNLQGSRPVPSNGTVSNVALLRS
ncbi:hypothetical protein SAMCCGM7_pC0815 (plasmid) [Sinorhizobium americanum CCGM7]|nr:hypothetical protein SAMCCGM7_pC0815 [Sinorhizobium americanum CCGM7]